MKVLILTGFLRNNPIANTEWRFFFQISCSLIHFRSQYTFMISKWYYNNAMGCSYILFRVWMMEWKERQSILSQVVGCECQHISSETTFFLLPLWTLMLSCCMIIASTGLQCLCSRDNFTSNALEKIVQTSSCVLSEWMMSSFISSYCSSLCSSWALSFDCTNTRTGGTKPCTNKV